MNRRINSCLLGGALLLVAGCQSSKYEAGQRDIARPTNCATAEGDIRLLLHEKAHVQDQILAGASWISPAGAVMGILTGKEGTNIKVAIGDYNKKIDAKIAAIKEECGLD